jgi:hypothetical protein
MGEIAEDCYDRAMDDYYEMSDGDRYDFEMDWAGQRIAREAAVQRRRVASARSTRDMFSNLDDPPF